LLARSKLSHRHVFTLALALGLGGLLLATAAVATAIASVHHGSTDSRLVLVAGIHFTYPNLNGAAALLLPIAAIGAAAIVVALRASWRQLRAYRSWVDRIGVVEPLDKDPRVTVIADPLPQAFCAGYLHPRVYVSRRTVELLTEAELHAVLAHEDHHRRVRDPLRLAYARILSEALFFVPVLRSLSERYADLAELSADHAAVRANAGEAAPLASALLAFDQSGPSGAGGISPERVDSLLGEPIDSRLPPRLLAASLGLLSGMSTLVCLVSGAASAHATFNLPILSSQPCVVVLMTIILLGGCVCIFGRPARRFVVLGRARKSSSLPATYDAV
jgi:Zn-dependent protease with chaperone function